MHGTPSAFGRPTARGIRVLSNRFKPQQRLWPLDRAPAPPPGNTRQAAPGATPRAVAHRATFPYPLQSRNHDFANGIALTKSRPVRAYTLRVRMSSAVHDRSHFDRRHYITRVRWSDPSGAHPILSVIGSAGACPRFSRRRSRRSTRWDCSGRPPWRSPTSPWHRAGTPLCRH